MWATQTLLANAVLHRGRTATRYRTDSPNKRFLNALESHSECSRGGCIACVFYVAFARVGCFCTAGSSGDNRQCPRRPPIEAPALGVAPGRVVLDLPDAIGDGAGAHRPK
jgi:hypothetical protein